MSEIFLEILNMSITATWVVLAVIVLRLLLRKAPTWINLVLWGIVALRLIVPFSFESALTGNIKGKKIGVPTEYLDGIDNEVLSCLNSAVKNFNHLGADCIETNLKLYKYALPAYYLISSGEASTNLARYDGIKYGYKAENCDDLENIYQRSRSFALGSEVKRRILLGTYVLSSKNYSAYFQKAQKVRTLIIKEFEDSCRLLLLIKSNSSTLTAGNEGLLTNAFV